MKLRGCGIAFAAVALLAGCGDSGSSGAGASDDQALRQLVTDLGLTGDPAAGRDLPHISSPRAELGRDLFFAKSLGGDHDSACVTCHHPALGGGDALPMSIGVGAAHEDLLGPGRDHPDGDLTVPRNAPTTFNIGLWDDGLFWDGRVESLGKTPGANGDDGQGIRTPDSDFGDADPEAGNNLLTGQARFPVTSADEMRGFEFVEGGTNAELRAALEARLASDGSWPDLFQEVYGTPSITYARIADAIGEYERSQIFVDSAWSRYVAGDDEAIDAAAKRGALSFLRSRAAGGADCASCHSGDFFTDQEFHGIAAPQIGRGKGDGPTETNDYGRARETSRETDRYRFRTPTLLNVAVTGPYTHAGAFATLEAVIRHHLDPIASLTGYDPAQSAPAVADDLAGNTDEMLAFFRSNPDLAISTLTDPLTLSDGEVDDLVSFLESLTDPCVEDRNCLAPWIPAPDQPDPDGHRLIAVDESGNPL